MKKPKKSTLIRYFYFIEAPIEKVGPEFVRWHRSPWWPKESILEFSGGQGQALQPGMILNLKILIPLARNCTVKVTECDSQKGISITFKKGMLTGVQRFVLEGRYNGTRINAALEYTVDNILDHILWQVLFQQKYHQAVKAILESFKKYIEKKQTKLAL